MSKSGSSGTVRVTRGQYSSPLYYDNDPSFEAFYKNELDKQKNIFDEKKNLLESMNRLLHKNLKEKAEDLEEANRELKELSQVFKLRAPK